MFKEFKQLDEGAVLGKTVILPTDASALTAEEKQESLRVVNLIKEKKNGIIKEIT